LAIRSGTAAKLGWDNYDRDEGELRFETKLGEKLTLPVTREVAEMIDETDCKNPLPFVWQLNKRSKKHPMPKRLWTDMSEAFRRLGRNKLSIKLPWT
jgi:hypothetical protein